MKDAATRNTNYTVCPNCKGRGKKSRRLRKKVKLQYQKEVNYFEKTNCKGTPPVPPKADQYPCKNCNGSGLISAATPSSPDTKNYPHIAIIGGGIGGVALAVACLHRGIPFTIYERDASFDARAQGYGLTLQQASKAIEELGIFSLTEGIISTRHLVHTTDGKVIGEWGMRKWMQSDAKPPKRTNIHIARQSLRAALLDQLGGHDAVQWGHQLINFKQNTPHGIDLTFQVNGKTKHAKADIIVGADGIRSTVRNFLINEKNTPLRYLGCIVILGICPLKNLQGLENDLLDGATVFQTANGTERIYMMPYSATAVMWQLSFPMAETAAIKLSEQGEEALKTEACKRTKWHAPIPQILAATDASMISGYPVYDREILTPRMLENAGAVTLIGDAAHPMSPFKGQGANQALLDALALARAIYVGCRPLSNRQKSGVRQSVLTAFEKEMIPRSATKVKDSAAAAEFLHSDIVLRESDAPRGRFIGK